MLFNCLNSMCAMSSKVIKVNFNYVIQTKMFNRLRKYNVQNLCKKKCNFKQQFLNDINVKTYNFTISLVL